MPFPLLCFSGCAFIVSHNHLHLWCQGSGILTRTKGLFFFFFKIVLENCFSDPQISSVFTILLNIILQGAMIEIAAGFLG